MSGNNDADDSGVRFGSTFVFADTTGTTEVSKLGCNPDFNQEKRII